VARTILASIRPRHRSGLPLALEEHCALPMVPPSEMSRATFEAPTMRLAAFRTGDTVRAIRRAGRPGPADGLEVIDPFSLTRRQTSRSSALLLRIST
jgi:hypothetical protein